MSLGGFAYGLSQSIQKAEERYQDRIEREQARADRLAAQTAGFQFEEKMYKRRQDDAYKEKLSERYAGLQALFGSDERGQLLTTAFMPFDLESTRATVNDYKSKLEGSGVDFRDYFEVSNFDPKAGELPTLAKITQAFQARKEGKLDDKGKVIGVPEGFSLPTVGFKTFEPFSKQVRLDITDLFTDDAFESAQKLDAAIEIANQNINLGTPNEQKTTKRELEALKNLRVRNDARIANTSGTTDLEKSGYFTLAFDRVRKYRNDRLDKFFVGGRGEQRYLQLEGNRPNILSSLSKAYKESIVPNAPLFKTFKNNVQINRAFENAFDTDIVDFYNENLQTHTENTIAEGKNVFTIYQDPKNDAMKRANITAAEKIAKKGKGSVIIYIGADGKPKKPQVVDTFQVSGRQAVNIKHFRELTPIYLLQQEAEEAQLVNLP
jgi:hypothetical protein